MVDPSEIKNILYITMSNLGDAMMGLPAFDFLRRECPRARITVMAGPRTSGIFDHHPDVHELIVYDKHASLRSKIDLFFKLKLQHFDAIIDLRDTFYRWGLKAKYKNPARMIYPDWAAHFSQRHLLKAIVALRGPLIPEDEFLELNTRRNPSFISAQDEDHIDKLLSEHHISREDGLVLVFPGARSSLKKWHKEGFREVIETIRKTYGYKVAVTGDSDDKTTVREIVGNTKAECVDLSGKTNFGQISSLIKRSKLIVCNDSGVVHIASYLERPIVAIYGPTDYRHYGPWSKRSLAVRKSVLCAPCSKAHCSHDRECIKTVTPYDVILAVRLILESEDGKLQESKYKRILVVRTDRIGDVLLSTPVIKALRDHYPLSYIAMMVSPRLRPGLS